VQARGADNPTQSPSRRPNRTPRTLAFFKTLTKFSPAYEKFASAIAPSSDRREPLRYHCVLKIAKFVRRLIKTSGDQTDQASRPNHSGSEKRTTVADIVGKSKTSQAKQTSKAQTDDRKRKDKHTTIFRKPPNGFQQRTRRIPYTPPLPERVSCVCARRRKRAAVSVDGWSCWRARWHCPRGVLMSGGISQGARHRSITRRADLTPRRGTPPAIVAPPRPPRAVAASHRRRLEPMPKDALARNHRGREGRQGHSKNDARNAAAAGANTSAANPANGLQLPGRPNGSDTRRLVCRPRRCPPTQSVASASLPTATPPATAKTVVVEIPQNHVASNPQLADVNIGTKRRCSISTRARLPARRANGSPLTK